MPARRAAVAPVIDRPARGRRRPGRLHLVYEDEALIAVDKPAGLLSVPLERKPGSPSVLRYIEDRFRSHGRKRMFVVHRIDQDTSGLVVFAKDADVRRALTDQFRRREPERVYLAVVHGAPDPADGTWTDWLAWDERALIQKAARPGALDAEEAISHYFTLEKLRGASLLEVRLQTGRRNQIRVQAALRGHPLVGEKRYTGEVTAGIRFERQALHAFRLAFTHPVHNRPIALEAPPPADFQDLLTRLRHRRR